MKRIGRSPYNSEKETDRTFFSFERESRKGIEKMRNKHTLSSSVEDIHRRIDKRVSVEKNRKNVGKSHAAPLYSKGVIIAIVAALLIVVAVLMGYVFGLI